MAQLLKLPGTSTGNFGRLAQQFAQLSPDAKEALRQRAPTVCLTGHFVDCLKMVCGDRLVNNHARPGIFEAARQARPLRADTSLMQYYIISEGIGEVCKEPNDKTPPPPAVTTEHRPQQAPQRRPWHSWVPGLGFAGAGAGLGYFLYQFRNAPNPWAQGAGALGSLLLWLSGDEKSDDMPSTESPRDRMIREGA